MRMMLTLAATLAAMSFGLATAEALPVDHLGSVATPEVTLVSGGCGPYRHRGPYGGCRRNFGGPAFRRPFFGHHRFYGPRRFYGNPRYYQRY